MKLPFVVIIAATLGAPIFSVAQAPQTRLTRAQVRTDLRRVERAGYSPARRDDASYHADIQAAEARIAGPDGSPDETRSMGGTASSTSESGHARASHGRNTLYSHH